MGRREREKLVRKRGGEGERKETTIGMTHFGKGNDRTALGSIPSHRHLQLGLDYSSVSSIVIR